MEMTNWFTKKIIPQVILNAGGHSWLGFHTNEQKFIDSLWECSHAHNNNFFVLKQDGTILACQKNLEHALQYMNDETVLVHRERNFIPCLGFNKYQTDFLVEFQKRLDDKDDYAKKVWERYVILNRKYEMLMVQLAKIDNTKQQ